MVEWPRMAMMPPPGRPMLPSNSCRMPAAADHLHAGGVLRPPQGVDDGAGPLAPGVAHSSSATRVQLLRRAAAHLGDELRRVASEMALEELEDAVWVLQGRVAWRLAAGLGCHFAATRGAAGCRRRWRAVDPLAVLRRDLRRVIVRPRRSSRPSRRRAPSTLVAPVALPAS